MEKYPGTSRVSVPVESSASLGGSSAEDVADIDPLARKGDY